MIRNYIMCLLLGLLSLNGYGQQVISGTITSGRDGKPIEGVGILLPVTKTRTFTNTSGQFSIKASSSDSIIMLSHLHFLSQQISVPNNATALTISMEEKTNTLDEVVVSTGYQKISTERTTGSFEQIDRKLLDRSLNTDILSRIENLSSGTYFDRRTNNLNRNPQSQNPALIIRGVSTIQANASPLIVLDNFPYDGDMNNINPNDIESITLLKDAAAASIWGARAGNGVVVITTKNSKYSSPLKITLNTGVTVFDKPDLFKGNLISPSDKIDAEIFLFDKGYYKAKETAAAKSVLPPVVELLIKQRDQVLSPQNVSMQIGELRQNDIRDEYLQHYYRPAMNQQYAVNLSGGAEKNSFMVSVGHDLNLPTLKNTKYERTSVRVNNILNLARGLEIQTRLNYLSSNDLQPSLYSPLGYGSQNIYPYVRFADQDGGSLAVPFDYRIDYAEAALSKGLTDWTYHPLDEINLIGNRNRTQDFLGNISATYKLLKYLTAEVRYQYQKQTTSITDLLDAQSYYSRNLINRFSQIKSGATAYGVPPGSVLDRTENITNSQSVRTQLNFNRFFGSKHELSALAGYEVRNITFNGNTYRTYGYDDNLLTFSNVNMVDLLPIYDNLASNTLIPDNSAFRATDNRYISAYANGAYTYDRRYVFSMSARKDASNLFGVETNDKWTPLWSTGFAWNISNERFFSTKVLQYLKVRTTYGLSGNVDNSRSALTTLYYYPGSGNPSTQLVYAGINNPPNPLLRWEKVKTLNIGLDFSTIRRILYGSFEFYKKTTEDLLALTPLDITTGLSSTIMNSANTNGRGFDLNLSSDILNGMNLKWTTSMRMSYNKTIVSRYLIQNRPLINVNATINPIEGAVLYPVYAYRWAGLDPINGDPQGYYDSGISKSYSDIVNKTEAEDMKFFSSAIPLYFGSFRNDISYKQFALSLNISYQLGYYFRRQGITYSSIGDFGGTNEYAQRWQKAGDELNTNIPSFNYPIAANRDNFYNGSEINIERGDHIRLQDIRISYSFRQEQNKNFRIHNAELFFLANNLGILWRANKRGLDPQAANGIPVPRSFALGLIANL